MCKSQYRRPSDIHSPFDLVYHSGLFQLSCNSQGSHGLEPGLVSTAPERPLQIQVLLEAAGLDVTAGLEAIQQHQLRDPNRLMLP